ncbi:ABC transporter ATP-binding protein [Nocardioides mesophilus]|uniref:ABC-type quaternary amine transporter n=1 Tax=Nocardioides mesophilus TaxID=433659 RepID=A0A7G9R6G9_9ACTN|nr:ABC transporter ATP-binding protein [Nocardioides mesophilus]QNN51194.1 ABC transporter ATP-binding protein [Nocardioides mesophilus]
MLTVRDLSVHFDDLPAVEDVTLSLPTGEVLAVLGPSGCGKSTLLRAVAGLEPLASGSVSYDGRDLGRVPTHRRGFALMFQDAQLFWHQDVAGNVGYPLRLRRRPRAEIRARVTELLELVGLPGYGERSPATLSGGERQRVALARSLAAEPRLLLLDEPLSALDRELRERLAADLRQILVAAGTTALLVTHDQEEAFAVADRMAVMRAGRVVQDGTVEEVWGSPVDGEVAAFLGYATVLHGLPATRVLAAGGSDAGVAGGVALRRSALVQDPAGALRGRVVEARVTPEQLRLEVDVDGVGPAHAVADPAAEIRVGERVRLRVELGRAAVLPG